MGKPVKNRQLQTMNKLNTMEMKRILYGLNEACTLCDIHVDKKESVENL